jgi:hypothetical protein
MARLTLLAAALAGLWAMPVQAEMMQAIVADTHHAAGAGFQGVGDAVAGSLMHWGTIAYSAARRGQNMVRLCNSAVCADVASGATTGIVSNAPVINGAPCDNSGHICTVAKLYDDSGGVACTGAAACDLDIQTGNVTFVASASGSVPGISCDGTENLAATLVLAANHSDPVSSAVSYNPAAIGATQSMIAFGSSSLQAVHSSGKPEGYHGAALLAASAISAGTFVATTVTNDGAGNGSLQTNNGTAATGSIGTNGANTTDTIYFCRDGFGDKFNGTILEAFWHPAQFSAGDVTNITANMRANGGF